MKPSWPHTDVLSQQDRSRDPSGWGWGVCLERGVFRLSSVCNEGPRLAQSLELLLSISRL